MAQETVAPLLIMGNTTLLAISTLTSEINFYTRLMKMRDRVTGQPMFTYLSVELACAACKAEGRATECVHMLHLVPRFFCLDISLVVLVRPRLAGVPRGRQHGLALICNHRVCHPYIPYRLWDRWQSADRHVKLKTIMQDRPDLIESELSGLAFDSLQQVFKPDHIELMFQQPCIPSIINEDVHIFIDPAAGGPYSDYAIVSVTRQKGMITVVPSPQARALQQIGPAREGLKHGWRLVVYSGVQLIKYAIRILSTNSEDVTVSSLTHAGKRLSCSSA